MCACTVNVLCENSNKTPFHYLRTRPEGLPSLESLKITFSATYAFWDQSAIVAPRRPHVQVSSSPLCQWSHARPDPGWCTLAIAIGNGWHTSSIRSIFYMSSSTNVSISFTSASSSSSCSSRPCACPFPPMPEPDPARLRAPRPSRSLLLHHVLQLHLGTVHRAIGQLRRERADTDDTQCVTDGLAQRCDERGVAHHSDTVYHLHRARMDHLGGDSERPHHFVARGQQWHEPARRLSDTLMKIELERGERRVECLCEIGRELYAEERHVHITKIVKS